MASLLLFVARPEPASRSLISQASLQAQPVYKMCKQMFAALPLAAVVGEAALVLHGGLFRRPAQRANHRSAGGQALPKKRKRFAPMRLGNLNPTLGSLEVGLPLRTFQAVHEQATVPATC